MKNSEIIQIAQEVFREEILELEAIASRISESFVDAVNAIYNTKGKLVVVGVGKSAHIANKIVATLNSTGTPSQFLHATEAIHGDLGLVRPEDVVICISKSGNTPEITYLAPILKQYAAVLIGLTSNLKSELAKNSDIVLDVNIKKEACPVNLAPTTSTTAQLLMGDALAVALMKMRAFTQNDFAKYHPGGALGKRLLWTVENIVDPERKPFVGPESSISEVINSLTSGRHGITVILDEDKIVGVITDGDLRRMLLNNESFTHLKAKDIASMHPKTIQKTEKAREALAILRHNSIGQLVVVDEENHYYGILDIHSILNEGIE
ncbi:KpsF/GutQ family sugar-phosphate isomerase [Empedobacter falsenii]|uniref:KpsF/GutQ family sugar-phosphate isomerase n=1 Tax=Empedobacter stercoris TaxID=1628248 RepID=A0ABX1WIK7_9FLAO|nr:MULTISPECIES: KpsF/GutQ family sugar-phosphate isomerase [Empedobacter]MCA4777001.1 KpsF/GutQ family sugar-phosphate isomerase [Empedobacter stercoris]MCA4782320.1 KpsF/GutQ family sugar-phosphate isomerase [Empedobacter stercoris]MCA4810112.1 KpsF/GutQ family sugar-phosphate isomerase [Empedobacter stercoris]MDM1523986.1 KpsF/GutQ family sugar-phosphate isomerase [Empedobacter sp. 225-1]MDM1543921.1 KpsF/GutQ family sugar-phosphate isomerase [Empedobacter sp. 189-2]